MKKLWIHREIDAPAVLLWRLLTDPEEWPKWGPTVRNAELHGATFERGATGTVTTPVGIDVGFEITDCVEGERWAWKVAGVPATDHTVEALAPDRCRVGFGVAWVAAPYLAACGLALRRLTALAVPGAASQQVGR